MKEPIKGRGGGFIDRKWTLEFDEVGDRELAFAILELVTSSLAEAKKGYVFKNGARYPFTDPHFQGLTLALLNREAGYLAEEALRIAQGAGQEANAEPEHTWTRDDLARVAARMRHLARKSVKY